MSFTPFPSRPNRKALWASLAALGLGLGFWAWWGVRSAAGDVSDRLDMSRGVENVEATESQVREFCGACHASPSPRTFSRKAWAEQVAQGYKFFGKTKMTFDPPPQHAVLRYFENRSLESLPVLASQETSTPLSLRFDAVGLPVALEVDASISNVQIVDLDRDGKPEIVGCEMRVGKILVGRPGEPTRVVSEAAQHPGHVVPVDLDRDGRLDLLVSDLGTFFPSDDRKGAIYWLKGEPDGSFTSIAIKLGLGRVADVQPGDFDGDGDLDLIVAEFGWREVGSILYLENQSRPGVPPTFKSSTLDTRHGAINVPTADLDGDGRLDFVAMISQEYETIVAFLNRGPGKFEKVTLFAADHPAFGSSGLQLVDLDKDGDLDVLFTNGDVFDTVMLRPDNGVHWLENRGKLQFTFHTLTALYGTHRAQAADMDGDGDLDVVAASLLPGSLASVTGVPEDMVSLVLLEQIKPGEFVRHDLENGNCHHPTLDLGDVDGDGRADIVVGEFANLTFEASKPSAHPKPANWATIRLNRR